MYVYDVWVNLVDSIMPAYSTPEYHEWDKEKDDVQLMTQIPIVPVTTEFLTAVENGFDDLPVELLEMIKGKAYISSGGRQESMDYAGVISDGNQSLVVVQGTDLSPSLKSRLIPRQDTMVNNQVEGLPQHNFKLDEEGEGDLSPAGKLIHIENVHMAGLTRRERQMKEITVDSLFKLFCSENEEEVKYWYTDWFTGADTDGLTIEFMVSKMGESIKEGWGERHLTFGAAIAKYFDMYDGIWEVLEKGKDKVGEA